MPSTYSIKVKNKSGISQQYILFSDEPQVNTLPSDQVFTNIYKTAPTVPSGHGTASFTVESNFYAVCGTNPSPLGANVYISTSDYEPVNLGSLGSPGTTSTIVVADNAPSFDQNPIPSTAPNGAFTIVTKPDFKFPNKYNIFIGLGADDGEGGVAPIATFQAHPNIKYRIFPVVKFYISTGTYTAGEIIDVQSLGPTQLVDFTAPNPSSVTITHNSDGTFTLK